MRVDHSFIGWKWIPQPEAAKVCQGSKVPSSKRQFCMIRQVYNKSTNSTGQSSSINGIPKLWTFQALTTMTLPTLQLLQGTSHSPGDSPLYPLPCARRPSRVSPCHRDRWLLLPKHRGVWRRKMPSTSPAVPQYLMSDRIRMREVCQVDVTYMDHGVCVFPLKFPWMWEVEHNKWRHSRFGLWREPTRTLMFFWNRQIRNKQGRCWRRNWQHDAT